MIENRANTDLAILNQHHQGVLAGSGFVHFALAHGAKFSAPKGGRFDAARLPLPPKEKAGKDFSRLRSGYAYAMNQMAKRLAIIPAQWIGDRSYLPHRERTARPARRLRSRR